VYDAAKKRVWSTSDCFPGKGSETEMLDPNANVHFDIRWAGTTSAPGCRAERVPVAAGTYTAVARLGGMTAKPVTLKFTG
jgi:hypothetical protein